MRSPGTILSAQQPDARTSGRHRSTVSDRDGRESVGTVLLSYPVTWWGRTARFLPRRWAVLPSRIPTPFRHAGPVCPAHRLESLARAPPSTREPVRSIASPTGLPHVVLCAATPRVPEPRKALGPLALAPPRLGDPPTDPAHSTLGLAVLARTRLHRKVSLASVVGAGYAHGGRSRSTRERLWRTGVAATTVPSHNMCTPRATRRACTPFADSIIRPSTHGWYRYRARGDGQDPIHPDCSPAGHRPRTHGWTSASGVSRRGTTSPCYSTMRATQHTRV